MKTAEQLKQELHAYIDSINDEETLIMVHEDIAAYLNNDSARELEENYLTEEQEKELDEAIREADAGETISWEEFKQSMARWHTNS